MCNRHCADPTEIQLDLIIEMLQIDTTYSYIANTGRRTRPATSDIFPPSERQNSIVDWSAFPFFSKAFLSHKTKSHGTCMRSSTFQATTPIRFSQIHRKVIIVFYKHSRSHFHVLPVISHQSSFSFTFSQWGATILRMHL